MYVVTLCCVCVTIEHWKCNNVLCVYCWARCHCQQYTNTGCCTKVLLQGIYVAGNNKMYLGLHVNCPKFCPILTKFGVFGWIFLKFPINKFHRDPSVGGALIHVDRWTDRRTKQSEKGLFMTIQMCPKTCIASWKVQSTKFCFIRYLLTFPRIFLSFYN